VIILPIVVLGVVVLPILNGLPRERAVLPIDGVYEPRSGQEPGVDG
jgi:hypothetical protein